MLPEIEKTEDELLAEGILLRKPWPNASRRPVKAFLDVMDFVAGGTKAQPNAVYAGSVPYLMLAGNLVAGWQMGRALWWRKTRRPRDRM